MLVAYDYTEKMTEDIIRIDRETFGEISVSAAELAEKLENSSNYSVFVDYQENVFRGFIALLKASTLHYDAVWIDLMVVLPAYQGQGIAQEMIAEVKRHASERFPQAEFISALIRQSNLASIGAASKQGFAPDGKGSFELLFHDL